MLVCVLQYKCERCNTLNDSTKQLSLIQLPEILCIHVKRFRFDGYFGTGSKVSEMVEFPLTDFDLTSFIRKCVPHFPSEREGGVKGPRSN